MSVAVHPALDSEAIEAFFDVEQRALGGLPRWLPTPRSWATRLFEPAHNPLFEHIELERYVAERDSVVIGRIAAWIDRRRPDIGFFGFFDVVDDVEAGRALVWAAADWCRSRGRARVRGPIDFWTVCSAGVPTTGFDLPNTFALHHGGPHYAACIEAAGFEPVLELYTWQFGTNPVPPPALGIARATFANPAITLVEFDPDSAEHWELAAELYAACYVDDDWFEPMSTGELRLIGESFVDPAVSFLTFVNGTPAAMSIGLRNVVESSVRVGQVIPPEPIQRMLRPGRKPRNFRHWLFAIAPPYRGRALGHLSTALYVEIRQRAVRAGYHHGEAAWTQALDETRNAAFGVVGARRDKTYRVFESTMQARI